MSRGLGKLQRAILDCFNGKHCPVYPGNGALTTGEITDNLEGANVLPHRSRKRNATLIRRACSSLYHRGKLSAVMVRDDDHRCNSWSWKVRQSAPSAAPLPPPSINIISAPHDVARPSTKDRP